MQSELKEKTVLVTGGTGSIGSEIVRQLLNLSVKKIIIFAKDGKRDLLPNKKIDDTRLKIIEADIKDYYNIDRIFKEFEIDIVYHAAAIKHINLCEDFPAESAKTNILGTKNLVDIALRCNIKKLIAISTDKAVYPVSVMGATKLIAERITLNANYSCVRLGNVANSKDSVIPMVIHNILNKKPINITDPDATRFVMKIPEAAKSIIKVTGWIRGGEIFILKMKAFRLGDLLDVILERVVPKLGMSKKDIKVNMTGLIKAEKRHETLINDTELGQLYEMDGIYVILNGSKETLKYRNIEKSNLLNYSSHNAELISCDEIEEIVNAYLEEALRPK